MIVCEGYTDVIGFHRAGVTRAVATCGTALTEEHVRLLKRFASRVVLAFDADAAGPGRGRAVLRVGAEVPGAGQRGPRSRRAQDPGELSLSDPDALAARGRRRRCRSSGFRLQRVLSGRPIELAGGPRPAGRAGDGGGQRAPRRQRAQAVRRRRLPATPGCRSTIWWRREHGARHAVPSASAPPASVGSSENAEFVAIALLLQRWDDIAGWLDRGAVRRRCRTGVRSWPLPKATAPSDGSLELADPEAREMLERAAVADIDADPAVGGPQPHRRRRATRAGTTRATTLTPWRSWRTGDARVALEQFDDPEAAANDAAELLLGWLQRRNEERE